MVSRAGVLKGAVGREAHRVRGQRWGGRSAVRGHTGCSGGGEAGKERDEDDEEEAWRVHDDLLRRNVSRP